MSYSSEYYPAVAVSDAGASARTIFLRKTYAHLAGAVLAFIALETVLVTWFENWIQDPANQQTFANLFAGRFSWLIVLGGFMAVGWIAQSWARSSSSRGIQYAGLALYVVAEALIFLPILFIADSAPAFKGQHIIANAGILTLTIFGGLTLGVFLTGKDFSYLGPILSMLGLGALGFIIASMIFGFSLGLVFSFAMVALMCGYILYYTSAVMRHYGTEQYVAAALALFACIATLFWYILQIFMQSNRR